MKLGEIKIEALKLMNACVDRDIGIEDLDEIINEEEFRDYMIAMPGAINRCFADLEEKRVLPLEAYILSAEQGEALGRFRRFLLPDIIPQFGDLERLTYLSADGYQGEASFHREGDEILIEDFDADGCYRLLYRPVIPPVTSFSDDAAELPIPDRIAVWIPQFIKGDLYRGDEPEEASAARNLYEQQMAQIAAADMLKESRQRLVRSVYDVMEV